MLFGNKRRAVAGGAGGMGMPQPVVLAPGDSVTDLLQGRSEPASRLLNRAVLRQCPSEIERLLARPGLPPSLAGIGDSMVWVVDEEASEVVWWRYKQAAPAAMAPSSVGRVRLHRLHGGDRPRAVIAYDVRRPGSANECEPCIVIASAAGIQALQLCAPAPQDDSDFCAWRDLDIVPGEATLLCAESEESHSNVILCNRACELVVFRHEFSANNSGAALTPFFEIERESFGHKSLVTRLGMGNSSLGSTLRRFMGSQQESFPTAMMLTRVPPVSPGRRTGMAGRSHLSVTVLSQNDVYVWRLAPVEEARWETDGYLRLEASATRSRTALDAVLGGSSPASQHKQNVPIKFVDMCMQWSCSANGKWGDACVQILALHADAQYHVHFLSPADLEPLSFAQRLPICDDIDIEATSGAPDLKMLPCTVTVDGREACNLHVTDGQRVLSVRKSGSPTDAGANLDAEGDWHVGPNARVVAARPMLVDREKQTHAVVLTVEAVMLLTPSVLDERAQCTTDGERLQSVLKRATSVSSLEAYLKDVKNLAPEDAEEAAVRLTSVGLPANEAEILFSLLVKQVVDQVVDVPVEPRQGASATAGSEKDMLTMHLDSKERAMKQVRTKLEQLIPEHRGILEAMDRLGDRIRACNVLVRDPSLVPGGASVMAQAIQLTVNRKEWMGENALRPWAVAWRNFAQKSSRVADVLWGLKSHLEQLCDADVPLPTLAAALGDSLKLCRHLLGSLRQLRLDSGADAQSSAKMASEYAGYADKLGVEHLVNRRSVAALGTLVEIVEKVCRRCADKARAAGSGADPRVLALKGSLLEFQLLHLDFFEYGHQQYCFDQRYLEEVADSWRVCAQRYLELWRSWGLDCVAHRVKLASKLAKTPLPAAPITLDRTARALTEMSLDTLVHVALHELPSKQAMCAHNDHFGRELQGQGYGVRLLRALVDTCPPGDARGSLWDVPFSEYDFGTDLETMLQEREAQKVTVLASTGPSNLGWIAGLRSRDVCSKAGKAYDAQRSLNNIAHSMVRMGSTDVAPDIYAHMALNGMARLAAESSRRRANPASRVLPIDSHVKGALLNAAVQLREGGVRRPLEASPEVASGIDTWDIPTTAFKCVEAAGAQLQDAGSAGAGMQRVMVLLRDGMALLGHWPHEPEAAQPSQQWQEVYKMLFDVAARADLQNPNSRYMTIPIQTLLVSEALLIDTPTRASEEACLGAPHRRAQSMAWPTHLVQYNFARSKVSM